MIIIQQVYDIDNIVISVVKLSVVKFMFVDVRTIATCSIYRQICLKTTNQNLEYEANIEKNKEKIAIDRRIVNFIYVKRKAKSLIHRRLEMNVRMKISFVCSNSLIEKINKAKKFQRESSFC